MPPVAALQAEVEGYDGQCLRMRAPLAANVNDKGTAFGGSLVSLMTVAGWGWISFRLAQLGLEAEVYVADSHVRYLAPLRGDLQVRAWLDEGEDWEDFVATLRRRGRARLKIEAATALPEGGDACTLSSRYVAIATG